MRVTLFATMRLCDAKRNVTQTLPALELKWTILKKNKSICGICRQIDREKPGTSKLLQYFFFSFFIIVCSFFYFLIIKIYLIHKYLNAKNIII